MYTKLRKIESQFYESKINNCHNMKPGPICAK